MNELLSKISSYNLFNYLLPGATLVVGASQLGIVAFEEKDLATRLLVFYVTGLVVSRLASLFLAPALHFLRVARNSEYRDYVLASKIDDKLPVFVEVANTYRALAASLGFLSAATLFGYASALPRSKMLIVALALAGCFATLCASVRKQSNFINQRVRIARETDHGSC